MTSQVMEWIKTLPLTAQSLIFARVQLLARACKEVASDLGACLVYLNNRQHIEI